MKRVLGVARWIFVTLGIVVVTSFTIDATDGLRGSESALLSLTRGVTEAGCQAGTVEVRIDGQRWCVDQYENSTSEDCPVAAPKTALESRENVNSPDCQSVSEPERIPWAGITYHQAKTVCAARQAQLVNNAVWYESALGTREVDCNLDGALARTGQSG